MNADTSPWLGNASRSIKERTHYLLSHMTLEEKIAQLGSVWIKRQELENDSFTFVPDRAESVMGNGIGQLARPSENKAGDTPNKSPQQTLDFTNQVQRWLVNNTRLKIPAIHHAEALHGLASRCATSFPQAIALASTWSPEIVRCVYTVAAREAYLQGVHQVLAPVLDVVREPRWGRFEETMGEDPYLVASLGLAAVQGIQGDRSGKLPKEKVIATLKHLAGHGEPKGGRNTAPAPVSERTLREIFLFPFEVAVVLGGARSVMASYNEIDGVPSHANRHLLRGILRNEWGFEGVVVSDYFAIDQLIHHHGLAENKAQAAKAALSAGVDVEMPDLDTYGFLDELVKIGGIPEALLDESVERILHQKFLLGLFEHPFRETVNIDAQTGSAESRKLAQTAAEMAMVLLRNEDKLLPLDRKKIKSLAVIGPHVDETLLGAYSDVPKQTVSILEGIIAYVGKEVKVRHAKGAILSIDPKGAFDSKTANTLSKERWMQSNVLLPDTAQERILREEAVEAARASDVTLLVLGENEGITREGWSDNHLGDRTSLKLFGSQTALAEAVLATGKPVILLMQNGRPLAISDLAPRIPAILEGWYLGQETGAAVARVLFGEVNPSGKLPVSIPRSVGHIPVHYNHKKSANRGYAFDDATPLYPFGFGLSYTEFSYSRLKLSKRKVNPHENLTISATIQNKGTVAGAEVVQLYLNDPVASVTRPVKELRGFKRISLQPKARKRVSFTLNANQLAFYNIDMKYVLEPGLIKVMIGSSSADIRLTAEFEIIGKPVEIRQPEKHYLTGVTVST